MKKRILFSLALLLSPALSYTRDITPEEVYEMSKDFDSEMADRVEKEFKKSIIWTKEKLTPRWLTTEKRAKITKKLENREKSLEEFYRARRERKEEIDASKEKFMALDRES